MYVRTGLDVRIFLSSLLEFLRPSCPCIGSPLRKAQPHVKCSPLVNVYGNTDAEATQIVFDPERITYRELLEFFYRMHDPTTKDQQGGDTGTQYRSGIFYHDEEQKRIAQEVTAAVNEQWYGGRVTTEIVPAGQWWDAEDYHQLYLDKNPSGYQCASHYVRDYPPLK